MTCKELAEKLQNTPDMPLYISVDADGGEYLFPLECHISQAIIENNDGTKCDGVILEVGELSTIDYEDVDEEETED